jgi:nitroreductase
MELMDVISGRRAVREFTGTALDRSTLEKLVAAAIEAPSAMNRQPWAFAVVSDRGKIEHYAERAKRWLMEHWEQMGMPATARELLQTPDFSIFYHAPALILVLATEAGTQASEDCCLAAENLMLAARNQGIGTCWIGFARPWLDLPATKRELSFPEQYRVIAPIVLGHPTKWPSSHGRRPAEIHWLQDASARTESPKASLKTAEVVLRDFDGSRTIYVADVPLQRFVHTTEVQDLEASVGKTYLKTEEIDDHGRVVYAEQH